jgi:hypothetical protein
MTVQIAEPHSPPPDHYIAWMDVGSGAPSTRCRVEDVSHDGAKLLPFAGAVPNEFTRYFNRRGDAKVRCRVTARTAASCNVEFVASLAIYG